MIPKMVLIGVIVLGVMAGRLAYKLSEGYPQCLH